ncbi:ribonuclease H-like YkuK family protein [Ectobacillus ponti]|uniref:Ribonuclease H-like YkuK family protein n=1 Tax=Ectobacillus ponti TaxID=2961894 RepID=A0AA42BS08_9BACI|nr:ribonuclease H-like YkuK family protein [Ectobacillus ponti]MCP8970886.1 ribonuclease H-like YkuK family protein [Ectobacillus ponti]
MEAYCFYNLSERRMMFQDVFRKICEFMRADPRNVYRLSIGTDSQVHQAETRFVTAVHLHRVGKGAWGCLRQQTIHRPLNSLREKIMLETYYSQEVAYLFTAEHMGDMLEIVYPYRDEGASLLMEIHLDIGRSGLTKDFIQEMTARIHAMGLTARIKPEAYAAFSYANRYTK